MCYKGLLVLRLFSVSGKTPPPARAPHIVNEHR